MPKLIKQNASGKAGVIVDQAGGLNSTGQNNVLNCSTHHISNVVRELHSQGIGLQSTSGLGQTSALQKVLKFRGARGLNTFEGAAAGYARLAARIQDLRDAGWVIQSQRENLIGPDGLAHHRVARYVLVGKRQLAAADNGGSPC